MSLHVSEKSGSGIAPLPEDTYPAVCYALIDLGQQYSAKFEKYSEQVAIGWEIIGETITVDGEDVPRSFFNTYNMSLNEKAKLRKDLVSWRGKEFSVEELKDFNLRNILGKPCMIQIIHKKNADGSRVYANLGSVTKIPKGFPIPKGQLEPMVFDFSESDPAVVDTLPQWMQDKIKASESYTFFLEEWNKKPRLAELPDDSDGELPF